jgi:hypothetical protein
MVNSGKGGKERDWVNGAYADRGGGNSSSTAPPCGAPRDRGTAIKITSTWPAARKLCRQFPFVLFFQARIYSEIRSNVNMRLKTRTIRTIRITRTIRTYARITEIQYCHQAKGWTVRGFECWKGYEIPVFSRDPDRSRCHPASYAVRTGDLSPGVKRPER